jgi:hypothetical protein
LRLHLAGFLPGRLDTLGLVGAGQRLALAPAIEVKQRGIGRTLALSQIYQLDAIISWMPSQKSILARTVIYFAGIFICQVAPLGGTGMRGKKPNIGAAGAQPSIHFHGPQPLPRL